MPLSFPGKCCSLFCSPSMCPCSRGIRKCDGTERNNFQGRENTGFLGKRTPIFVHIEEQQPSPFMKHTLPSGVGGRRGRGKEAQGTGRHKGNQAEQYFLPKEAPFPHLAHETLLSADQECGLGPPPTPTHHAQKWLLLERAAGSGAVLPFYFSWDTQGDVGTATGVVRGSPHLPSPAAGEGRGPGALVLGWSSHCGPRAGGPRAQGGAPGRVGRAPRRGSGFFIKSHEA